MEKIRLAVAKNAATQYVGHLDFCRALERAMRRAKLPVAQSEGFNPHMKLSFGPALGVGVASQAEYVDVELAAALGSAEFGKRLAAQMPPGLELVAVRTVDSRASLAAALNVADYRAELNLSPSAENLRQVRASLAAFAAAESVPYTRHTPKGEKQLELKQYLLAGPSLTEDGPIQLEFRLRMTAAGAVKPQEILATLIGQFDFPAGIATHFTRTGLWHDTGAELTTAFDI